MSNTKKVLDLLKESPRGLTISEISDILNLNRHTVRKILERLLIEKRVDYEEKGPAKIFYFVGEIEEVAKIDLGNESYISIDKIKSFDKEFIRISQLKKDSLVREKNKFRIIGSVAISKEKLKELLETIQKLL
jgi:predicted ArsR family transcriptional regulator